ncbi:MAG TPA: GNAT family N-acetyltransferase [Terracidiphilus sp.]
MAIEQTPDPVVEVVAAGLEQKTILANLLELYSHDFSEFIDLEIGRDGRFGYRDLDLYWTDPQRFPFLVHVGGVPGGFVLVMRVSDSRGEMSVWEVAEFFVVRGFRRRAIGTRAALEVFARFPGRWQVRVMQSNLPACVFWSRTVRAFAGDAVILNRETAHGKDWNMLSFHSPPRVIQAQGWL